MNCKFHYTNIVKKNNFLKSLILDRLKKDAKIFIKFINEKVEIRIIDKTFYLHQI